MRISVDIDSAKILLAAGTTAELTSLSAKRSPTLPLEVQFLRNVTPVELPAGATGIFELKTKGEYDADPLSSALAWVKTGTGVDTIYTFTLVLINTDLDELLAVNEDADDDVVSVTLMAELQWIAGGTTSKSQTLDFVLVNDVVRDGDVPPSSPALVYAVFLPGIDTLAAFKAVTTVGLTLGYLVEILVPVSSVLTWLTYRLVTGAAVAAEPGDVAPNDYDVDDNDVHWQGAVGPSGPAGVSAGLPYQWLTAVDNTDPTSGKLKVNNATLASATALYISETDQDGANLAALLATWDDGTSTIKGRLYLMDPATPTNFALYDISGTRTDNGDWDTFTIAHVASGGAFTNNLPIRLAFAPTGDKGDVGSGATVYPASSTIPAGSSANIDWATLTTAVRRTLSANSAFTHINKVDGKVIVIPILNTASNYTVTWTGVDYWLGTGGVAPTQSPGAVCDVYTFFYDGTYTYGSWAPGV